MRHRFAFLAFCLLLGWVSSSCGGSPPEDDAATFDPELLPARINYRTHCSACHGRNGHGAARLYPPLRGSEWVNGDAEIPVRIVLHGLKGLLTVEGQKYLNTMPPLGHRLSDTEVAGILTYVRASWGNHGSAVAETEVARVRAKTADRAEPWTERELKPLLNTRTN